MIMFAGSATGGLPCVASSVHTNGPVRGRLHTVAREEPPTSNIRLRTGSSTMAPPDSGGGGSSAQRGGNAKPGLDRKQPRITSAILSAADAVQDKVAA